jgi:hypothetical protein
MSFVAVAIGGIVASTGVGIANGVLGSQAAGHAADTQAAAADRAAQLQHQDAQDALAFQKDQFSTSQANLAPWLKQGQSAITTLGDLMNSGSFGDWTGKFTAPTDVTEQNDPGYQFRLAEGQKAIQNSASATGNLTSGGTLKDLMKFGQDYGSSEYGNVYNRALNDYQLARQNFLDNNTNRFNRYASIAGVGQQAANTTGQLGQSASNNVSNTLLTSGAQIGQNINNAAAARASGYVGGANAWTGALGGIGNGVTNSLSLLALMKPGSVPFTASGATSAPMLDPFNLPPGSFGSPNIG